MNKKFLSLKLPLVLIALMISSLGTQTNRVSATTIPLTIQDISPDASDLYGGRVADMALDPSTSKSVNKRILAISDNGGLWASTDTGNSWSRRSGLDRFGQFQLTNIVFDPTDGTGSRVFLLSRGDNQSPTQSGVYRSTDGGATWLPAQTNGSSNHPSGCLQNNATRLAVDPTNRKNVYVAAQCAIGISHDAGASFQWVSPNASDQFYNGIMVDKNGRAFACGQDGIYQRKTDGNWISRGSPLGLESGDCFIAADPYAASTFYIAGHWNGAVSPGGCSGCTEIFEADWNGTTWVYTALLADPKPNGRPVFIQPHVFSGGDEVFSIYYGNSVSVEVINCNPNGKPTHCPMGPRSFQPGSFWRHVAWTGSAVAVHADPTSLVFDPGGNNCLLLYAADGGFERPRGANCDGISSAGWTKANQGFHAQEIYNMSATQRLDGTMDLYINMQDIGFMYRTGISPVWSTIGGNDGVVTSVDRVQTASPIRLVFVDMFGGNNAVRKAGAFYANPSAFTGPAGWNFSLGYYPGRRGVDWFGNRRYAVVVDNGSQTQLFTTTNEGGNWTAQANPLNGVGDNDVRVSGTTTSPVFYVRAGRRLWQIPGLSATSATAADVGLNGVGFFGVSGSNSNVLYAFDCAGSPPCTRGRIVQSINGGSLWARDSVATRLSQSDRFGNRYPNGIELGCACDPLRDQPQVFEFDPVGSNILVIGLRNAGLLVSIDRGNSWGRLPLTVPFVSSVVFGPERGHFYFSTYGRGVWEVWLGASRLILSKVQTSPDNKLTLSTRLLDINGAPLSAKPIVLRLVNNKGVVLQKIVGKTTSKGIFSATFDRPSIPGTYYFRAVFSGDKTILGAETERRYIVP
jgi:hypothetical protein